MIDRPSVRSEVNDALDRSKAVMLVGPRQCGKTTLAREFVPADSPNYFDLEDPTTLRALEEPLLALSGLRGLVVIDEVQRRPDLFPVLRVLLDREPLPAQFLILGSASPVLLRQSSESLAGRVARVTMGGLSLNDTGAATQMPLWLRGGFPEAFLASSDDASLRWRRDFVETFIERDLPAFGLSLPGPTLRRFWTMLAHYHGQIWNAAGPAGSLGISQPTARRYLDLLDGFFMMRQLQPWHANVQKRQVKSPKIYVRDSGLLHQLLGIATERDLLSHPKLGASWESFVIEQLLRAHGPDESYFWATHNGAEIDLLMIHRGARIGVECKAGDAPGLTPSMRIALTDLALDRLFVVYPGNRRYALADRVEALPLSAALARDVFAG